VQLRKHFVISAVFAVLAFMFVLLPSEAADEVDQDVSVLPPEGVQSWSGPDILRQTFTPEEDSLTKVALYLAPAAVTETTGDVFVTVEVKVVGAGTVIGSDIELVPDGFEGGWVEFDFPTVAVTPGDDYAIEASVDDDSQALGWGTSTSIAYAGGQAGLISGMILSPQTYDFLFKTYYEESESPECGSILFGSAPPPGGGFGTFALNCGSLDQLVEASGCPEATATFFYNKPDGSFAVYIPGALVAIVNEEFTGIFDGDPAIEENTIFTAKCV
jgi:hypothetical protein